MRVTSTTYRGQEKLVVDTDVVRGNVKLVYHDAAKDWANVEGWHGRGGVQARLGLQRLLGKGQGRNPNTSFHWPDYSSYISSRICTFKHISVFCCSAQDLVISRKY